MEATLTLKAKDLAGGAIDGLKAKVGGLAGSLKGLNGGFKGTAAGLGRLTVSATRAGAALTGRLGGQAARRVAADVKQIGKSAMDTTRAFGALGMAVTRVAALGAGLGYGFKRIFVDAAAKTEEYGRQISNALGDKVLGGEALKSVRAFAAGTGRELGEATNAFVALAEGGIKPTAAHLSALADMAAKKNKGLAETGEIFKRALKGEAGALAEWGVKSEARGKRILYQYKNQAGELVKLAAKANDPAALARLLERVAKDKAAGAEKDRGDTLTGGLSKLTAKWSEFRQTIMDSGPFQFLKEEMAGILSFVNDLEDNGGLKKLAEEWGGELTGALKNIKEGFKTGWVWLSKWGPKMRDLAGSLGGAKTVAIALSAVLGRRLVGSLGAAVKSVAMLGKALLLTPAGLILTAVAGVAALMHEAGVLTPLVEGLKTGFEGFGAAIGPSLTGLAEALAEAVGSASKNFKDADGNINPQAWRELGEAIAELTTGSLAALVKLLTETVRLLDQMGKDIGYTIGRIAGGDVETQELANRNMNLAHTKRNAAVKKNGGKSTKEIDEAFFAEMRASNDLYQSAVPSKPYQPRGIRRDGAKTWNTPSFPAEIDPNKPRYTGGGRVAPTRAPGRPLKPPEPSVIENPEDVSKPIVSGLDNMSGNLGGQLAEIRGKLNQPQRITVDLKLSGSISGGQISAAATATGANVLTDKQALNMGHRGSTL